ncbi:MAG: hypothetical protein N2035_01065 [Chthoniobacterales bacterium]|nr:hypothetical protein [Chthoniobacterales bacterium]MCX7712248.1 hypothetical protein [Chthoniobacterales bacterium]
MSFLLEDAIERIRKTRAKGRLAHAYLVTAAEESTNEQFIKNFASLLLSTNVDKIQNHPDYHEVRPESKSRRILIEQIRELEMSLHQTPTLNSTKVAVIFDADRLNEAAANAFLKTLEEPPEQTKILLTSTLPTAILKTILSRCVHLPLRTKRRNYSARELAAREIAISLLDPSSQCTIERIFAAAQRFHNLFTEIREVEEVQAQQILKSERERYRETTDVSQKWFDDLEAKLVAIASAHTLMERSLILDAVTSVFAEELLQVTNYAPHLRQKKRAEILKKIELLRLLRVALERGVHESLAIETYFLEAFLPHSD